MWQIKIRNFMYYILDRKDGLGRPPFINAMMHESFIEKGADVPMEYDWNFAPPPEKTKPLPNSLWLISKDKKYNFDFATTFNGHIVSEEFLSLMNTFDISRWEKSELNVVDQKGKSITEKKYYFIRESRSFWEKDIINLEKSKIDTRKNGEIKKIWSLSIKNCDLPDIFHSTEVALTGFVFFSERFYQSACDFKWGGFEFISSEYIGNARFA
ncbi:Imm43 family immunity protein [Chromobacterium sp. IIBBL 290-4]|uniref:Imm43 family immunity protein n=1 Tax=Chromobacterium sp. IIBBL 290-4 TaxID=2953890 RepID=UPI0020B8AD82|nr:Imm43 family immunity protein [Chromobacterium sp. IIBBL 290-4]UTH76596.1 Imm43 family immunity protein [Chromobacterium sp. IIBBL 290-4]